MANPVGRPLKFQSVEEFQTKVDDYFARTPITQQTITGLALHLDTFRDVLCDYQLKDEFSIAVKTAKLRVENAYELSLRTRGSAGDIFGLKNFGWRDKQEIESSGEITHKFEDLSDEQLERAIKDREADVS